MAWQNNRIIVPACQKPAACTGCVLSSQGEGFVPPQESHGLADSGLLILSERPDAKEVEYGTPLHPSAPTGSVFEKTIRKARIDGQPVRRENFTVSNLLSCRPPNGQEVPGSWFEFQAIEHCKAHWEQLIIKRKPRVILACGAPVLRTLTGLGGMKELSLSMLRGYPIETTYGLVIGTYNPAMVKQNPKLGWVFLKDFERALKIAKHGWNPPMKNFALSPGLDEAEALTRRIEGNSQLWLACDIETDKGEDEKWNILKSIQFSLSENDGWFFDWNLDFLPFIRRSLAAMNPKVGHNFRRFDLPRLREAGGMILNGRIDDTSLAFRQLHPDLMSEEKANKKSGDDSTPSISSRSGLQFVASIAEYNTYWKHLRTTNPRLYGVHDTAADLKVWNWLRRELEGLRYTPIRGIN